eukprot:3419532-Prymnesium_polylepis.1
MLLSGDVASVTSTQARYLACFAAPRALQVLDPHASIPPTYALNSSQPSWPPARASSPRCPRRHSLILFPIHSPLPDRFDGFRHRHQTQ